MNSTPGGRPKPLERSLPKGWRWSKLSSVSNIIMGQSPPGNTYRKTPEGLPFFQGKADFGLRHPVARVWCVEPTRIASPGAILLSVRAPVGPTNVADVECCIGRGLAAIQPNEQSDKEFILLALKYREDVLIELGSGSTFEAIRKDDLFELEVPLPPLDEQGWIAARLNEQLAAVESARKAADEQLQAARQLPSAYLRELFDKHAAESWPKVRLGDILKLRKEIIHPYQNPTGPAVFVGLEHIESNTGVRIGSLEVEMSKLAGRKPKFYKGDIVYGYLRPYLNKVWIAEFDGLCSVDQYIYAVENNKADANFVAWFMRSPVYLERAPIDTTPGQLPRIRTEEVASVEINLPPLQQQKDIASQISGKLRSANNLVNTFASQLAEINRLPASLLREAFAGRL